MPHPTSRYRAQPLLTPSEISVFNRLQAGLPDALVFPQVAHSAIIKANEGYFQRANQDKIAKTRVDFVICSTNLKVIALVELDDPHHDTPDFQDKDRQRDGRAWAAGYPTIRVNDRLGPYKSVGEAVADLLALQADPHFPIKRRAVARKLWHIEEAEAETEWQGHNRSARPRATGISAATSAGGWALAAVIVAAIVLKFLAGPGAVTAPAPAPTLAPPSISLTALQRSAPECELPVGVAAAIERHEGTWAKSALALLGATGCRTGMAQQLDPVAYYSAVAAGIQGISGRCPEYGQRAQSIGAAPEGSVDKVGKLWALLDEGAQRGCF
jgi:hypothetical protein